jgi:hypothetical protein
VSDGALAYTHQAIGVTWKLIPISQDRFRLDEDIKFEFHLDEGGVASEVVIAYRDGRPTVTIAHSA